jgi:PPM family protein phosphatase
LLLLCSDGLYSGSSDDDIAAVLSAASAENLDTTCTRLIEMAKRDGGRDNITAVLIQCR